jgi:amino-acid N-acetyltransferase
MDIYQRPDEADLKGLLAESGLPTADITLQHLHHFFGCASGEQLIGAVGLEIYGDVALLRSLAVRAHRRGQGIGSCLAAQAESHAREQGVGSLWLLTMTAEAFFRGRGYARVPREEAPAAIKATREFAGICPANSVLMVKSLQV